MAISAAKQNEVAGLLARIAVKNEPALKMLYDAIGGHLYAVAIRIVRTSALADEVVQDVFVNVWNKASDYNPSHALPMTWLISLTRNRSIDVLRAQDETVSLTFAGEENEDGESYVYDPVDESMRTPLQNLIAKAEGHGIEHCMGELESLQRQCIALAFFHGLSHAELAEHLSQPLGSVKSWVRRGMDRLGRCLSGAGLGGASA
jgi:RNA polymerase sigma-70 factor, ECF subfamily